jgi:hypothetical protein
LIAQYTAKLQEVLKQLPNSIPSIIVCTPIYLEEAWVNTDTKVGRCSIYLVDRYDFQTIRRESLAEWKECIMYQD